MDTWLSENSLFLAVTLAVTSAVLLVLTVVSWYFRPANRKVSAVVSPVNA